MYIYIYMHLRHQLCQNVTIHLLILFKAACKPANFQETQDKYKIYLEVLIFKPLLNSVENFRNE